MAAQAVVQMVGLDALRRDLNRAGTDENGPIYDAIRTAARAAVEPIAATTRSRLPADSGALAGTVRVTGAKTSTAVRMGRVGVPYAGWVEFGGTDREGGYRKGGRYLFVAAQALARMSGASFEDGIQKALDRFNWTNSGDVSVGAVRD